MKRFATLALAALMASLALAQTTPVEVEADRKPSMQTHGSVLIRNAQVLTITNGTLQNTDVLIEKGKITRIGRNLSAPAGVTEINGTGKTLMPGIVDTHSHRGIDGTNEGSDSITPEASVRWAVNPTDKDVWLAAASGHTTALLLHGSANAIGGESVVVKYKYGKSVSDMIFDQAPRMLKFALGENVTRKNSSETTRYPMSRLGVETVYRRAFTEAREYKQKRDAGVKMPRDVRLDTLADILDGKIWIHCHSYRADEMLMMVRLSQEFGFKIGALQHALEAYKIAPEMAKAGVGAGMFADHWAYKMEAYDAVPFNAAICTMAGVNVSINSDGTGGYTALNIDAAKTMRFGGMSENQALAMLTINGARQLGVDQYVGSIEVGKDGDVVLWQGHPLSTYAKPVMTLIEGEVVFERKDKFGVDGIAAIKNTLDPYEYQRPPATPAPSRSYAIIGATIHTMAGNPIQNGTLVISDGRIEAVGTNVSIPGDAVRIDAKGMNVYPGFIDGGSSIGVSEISGIRQMTDATELGDIQPDLNARTGLFVESVFYGTARFNGVTNSLARPLGGRISGQAAFVQHAGFTTEEIGVGPKAALVVTFPNVTTYRDLNLDKFCCGADTWAAMGMGWLDGRVPPPSELHGHDHDHEGDHHEELEAYVTTQDELPAQIRSLQEYFDSVKEYMEDHDATDLRMEAMIPYVKGEKPVLMRVRNAASIRAAVDFGKKNGLRVILAGAEEAWLEAEMLAREKVPVIIPPAGESTLSAVTTTRAWDPYDTHIVMPGILARAGVVFGFQTEDASEAMNLPMRVGTHCAFGLKPEDALRALTINMAQILGIEKDYGTLEKGKVATLFVSTGDPLDFRSNLMYLFIGGKATPLTSKHTELRDKYMERLQMMRNNP